MDLMKLILYCSMLLCTLFTFVKSDVIRYTDANLNAIKPRQIVLEDVSDISVFYSLKDNKTIKDMMPRPWIRPGENLRLPFIGDPCSCGYLTCGCCAGINITQIKLDKKVCANLTYDPNMFAVILDVSLSNKSVVHTVFSAHNPPPICIPIPLGPVPISGLDFCIRLYNISTPEVKRINICMNWEFRFLSNPLLVLQFDCFQYGLDGLAVVKPQAAILSINPDEEEVTQVNGDIYDEVTEIKITTESSIETITVAEEITIVTNNTNVTHFNNSQTP